MRLRRLPRAIRDVDDIWHWIAAEDPAAAERWTRRIVIATDRLVVFPNSGAPRPEFAPGARSIVVGRYLVIYRVGPDSVDNWPYAKPQRRKEGELDQAHGDRGSKGPLSSCRT